MINIRPDEISSIIREHHHRFRGSGILVIELERALCKGLRVLQKRLI